MFRALAGSGALAVSLAVPAAAQAVPAIAPLKPCYVTAETAAGPQSEGIDIKATGFVPNSKVRLAIDGAVVTGGEALQIDGFGQLGMAQALPPVPAPFINHGSRSFTVSLTQTDNPVNVATATAKSTGLGVYVKPKTAKPGHRIRIWGRGFTAVQPIWAHYVRKGKLRKTVRMARRPGECGSFDVHRRQIPIRKPRTGRWIVQFDQSEQYVDPAVQPLVYVRLTINLHLVRSR
jgi:hypothetical protein